MSNQVSVLNTTKEIINTGMRFPSNPFLDFVELKHKDKMIFAKTDSQALNTKTGEIMGQQLVATFKKVDTSKFVKIFTDKISHILNLSKAGHKMLIIILSHIQATAINEDTFIMSFTDAQFVAEKLDMKKQKPFISKTTFDRGIRDIIKHGLIARHYNQNMYFINPAIIYNGDRNKITFVEQYEVIPLEEFAQSNDLLSDLEN
jgi:hypothetical protein